MQSLEKKAKDYLAKFGITASVLAKWKFKRIAGSIWLISKELAENRAFNVHTAGLRLLHITKLGFKPTTYALQFLAPHIKKRVCSVNKDELLAILNGKSVKKVEENGYVAVRYFNHIIGCGLIRSNMLYSQFPKPIKNALLELLKARK